MRQTSPRSVGHILSSKSSGLERLLERVNNLAEVNRALHSYLAAPLNAHCQLQNIKGQWAVVHVDSSAWATRLRYQIPQLLKFLQSLPGLGQLKEIQIQIRPPRHQAPKPKARSAQFSAASAAAVHALAESTSDPKLSAALRRLANRHRGGSERQR